MHGQSGYSQSIAKYNYYPMQQSFKQNTPLIDRQDFSNKNNVLHNNLGDSLLAEHIVEYDVYISSIDRATKYYPSPFNFTTSFGGVQSTLPIIARRFENVKYINLDYVYLPRTYLIHVPPSPPAGDTYYMITTADEVDLDRRKFLVVRFEELSSSKIFSTGTNINDLSFVIYPVQDAGPNCVMWKAHKNSRVFQNSHLSKLSRLTPVLYDEYGTQITIIKRVVSGGTITDTAYDLANDSNQTSPPADLVTLNNLMQTYYSFTIGCVENEMNTLTNYS